MARSEAYARKSQSECQDRQDADGASSAVSRPGRRRRKDNPLWWYPFSAAAHRANHAELTHEQNWAFILLIDYQWRRGVIPTAPKQLAQICCCTLSAWERKFAPALLPHFDRRGDVLIEPYFEALREDARSISIGRRRAAQERWQRGKEQKGYKENNEVSKIADANVSSLHRRGKTSPGPTPLERLAQVGAAFDNRANGDKRSPPPTPVQPSLAMGPVLVRSVSPPSNVRKALFDEGIPILSALTGKTEAAVRPLLGKFAKQAKDDHAGLLKILRAAARERPVEPVSWISRCIVHQASPKPVARGVLGMLVAEREDDRRNLGPVIDADAGSSSATSSPLDPLSALDRMLDHG